MRHTVLSFVIIKLYLDIVSTVTVWDKELYEGSSCVLERGGIGICKKLVDCPEKLAEVEFGIRTGTTEGRCGFDGFHEIVCCFPNVTDKTNLRPAELACEEYIKARDNLTDHFVGVSGGFAAIQGEFPFVAALGFETNVTEDNPYPITYNCGGTLISYEHVLTAAHCVRNINGLVPVEVYLGNVRLYDTWSYTQRIPISNITIHPKFKRSRNYHDMAILKLEREITFSATVQPACIYPEHPSTSNKNELIVTGWGRTGLDDDSQTTVLMRSPYIGLMENKECNKHYQNFARIPNGIIDTMLCTKDHNKTRNSDACEGDSGGPLISKFRRYDGIIGVTTLGQLCGTTTPGVYTAIHFYLDWIEEQVWGKK